MRFRHVLSYDATHDEVFAMLADAEFREVVAGRQLAVRHTVNLRDTAAGMDVVVDLVRSTDGLPSFAAAMVGSEITTRQHEVWRTRDRASLELFVPGKPARMEGSISLAESDGVTTQTVSGDLKVAIPFIGGKVEGLIADLFRMALEVEEEAGREWLGQP